MGTLALRTWSLGGAMLVQSGNDQRWPNDLKPKLDCSQAFWTLRTGDLATADHAWPPGGFLQWQLGNAKAVFAARWPTFHVGTVHTLAYSTYRTPDTKTNQYFPSSPTSSISLGPADPPVDSAPGCREHVARRLYPATTFDVNGFGSQRWTFLILWLDENRPN
ncbi:uncharacterized protein CLUP02_06354 [Colletotrichum lupini]|uniref:Uncharacterized protein n=1 Tax=Colletotrichum lupini TaxID=145971 RepID=A0A9Q8SNY0_9PEZI|nr:uncharacterized protein CLUP02_06354 [Colletotrichum lupini]UQC80869.1 hypothetical protein CLUP02_06354 [Colletotrichum lupini]